MAHIALSRWWISEPSRCPQTLQPSPPYTWVWRQEAEKKPVPNQCLAQSWLLIGVWLKVWLVELNEWAHSSDCRCLQWLGDKEGLPVLSRPEVRCWEYDRTRRRSLMWGTIASVLLPFFIFTYVFIFGHPYSLAPQAPCLLWPTVETLWWVCSHIVLKRKKSSPQLSDRWSKDDFTRSQDRIGLTITLSFTLRLDFTESAHVSKMQKENTLEMKSL